MNPDPEPAPHSAIAPTTQHAGAPTDTVAVLDPHGIGVATERWARLARAVLSDEGLDAATQLNVIYVDEPTMAQLNGEHMGGDGPTDVLAFPIDGRDDTLPGPALAGDVVICPAVAERNARRLGRGTEDELALLLVHGILHVLGMDHAEAAERERMQARERVLLARHHAGAAGEGAG